MTLMNTYAEVLPIAETVTLEELAELLAATHGAATFYPGPRRKRRHGWDGRLRTVGKSSWVAFEYCTNTGADTGIADTHRSVYDFYNLGRIVRVAS